MRQVALDFTPLKNDRSNTRPILLIIGFRRYGHQSKLPFFWETATNHSDGISMSLPLFGGKLQTLILQSFPTTVANLTTLEIVPVRTTHSTQCHVETLV